MNHHPSRRTFLKTVGAAAAGVPLLNHSVARSASANGRLQVAGIGVGGMGWVTITGVAGNPNVDVVAVCDVDDNNLKKAADHFKGARTYSDWRELLAKEEKRIDAVTVATPDHMHAAIAMTAMGLGKHVYCQKPMCHDVYEVRQMTLKAREMNLVTQLGNQHSSGIGDRTAVQLLRAGTIGKIKEVYMWSNRSHIHGKYRLEGPRPTQVDPVPKTLHWDLWLGTAPARPFVDKILIGKDAINVYHPMTWRTWQDFGTGWGGDIGCHIGSAVFLALGLTSPTTIRNDVEPAWAANPARRSDLWPTAQVVTYEYPGTEMTADKTLTAKWLDGENWPSEEVHSLFEKTKWPEECAIFVGETGHLMLPHTQGPHLFPSKKFKDLKRPKLPAIDHYQSWATACIAGDRHKPISNFDVSGPLSEAVILGTVAARCPGESLQWDPANLKITNSENATKLLKRTYRDGWSVAGL